MTKGRCAFKIFTHWCHLTVSLFLSTLYENVFFHVFITLSLPVQWKWYFTVMLIYILLLENWKLFSHIFISNWDFLMNCLSILFIHFSVIYLFLYWMVNILCILWNLTVFRTYVLQTEYIYFFSPDFKFYVLPFRINCFAFWLANIFFYMFWELIIIRNPSNMMFKQKATKCFQGMFSLGGWHCRFWKWPIMHMTV